MTSTKHKPFRRGWVGLVAAALVIAGCGGDDSVDGFDDAAATPTTTAPTAPVVQAISGSQVDFADVLTQDTVLWFWAPW